MCAKLKTQFFLLTALLATGVQASAQSLGDEIGPKSTKENSPYSRYGIGDLSNQRAAGLRGMGGIATAYNDVFSVNSYNPATYSFLKVTTLDFAFEGRSRSIYMDNVSTSSGTATLSYLTIGIPMGKYAGMSVGITPMSNIYYNANDTLEIDGIGKSILNYNGSGSLQYAYLGLSGQYKGFSIGFNAGYVFGSTRYTTTLENVDVTPVRNSEFSRYNSVGGLYWKGGLLYKAKLKKDQYINIGAAVTLSQKLNVERDVYDIGFQYVSTSAGLEVIRDTVQSTKQVGAKGKLQLPAEYSFGVHYGREFRWNFGADFVYTDWKKFDNFGDRTGVGNTAWRLAAGGEITPNPEAQKKFFSLTTYRLGVYYGKDYIELDNTNITYVGGTVGASFPLKRSYTQFGRLHTALDIGQRGTIQNNLAREFFVKFTLGLSLNDIWFTKRKYD
jgi:long-subunit fatty acid transport protein